MLCNVLVGNPLVKASGFKLESMAEYKEYSCQECGSLFMGRIRDRKRGYALFCSRSCGSTGNYSQQVMHDKTCRNCGKDFKVASITTKYCSDSCKQQYKSRLRKTDRRKGIFKVISMLTCEICGYDKASRDVHHIHPVAEGGTHAKDNLISLCPNCHRECHENQFTKDFLYALIAKRDPNLFSS